MPIVLEWDVQQAHIGMKDSPHTIGHLIYINVTMLYQVCLVMKVTILKKGHGFKLQSVKLILFLLLGFLTCPLPSFAFFLFTFLFLFPSEVKLPFKL